MKEDWHWMRLYKSEKKDSWLTNETTFNTAIILHHTLSLYKSWNQRTNKEKGWKRLTHVWITHETHKEPLVSCSFIDIFYTILHSFFKSFANHNFHTNQKDKGAILAYIKYNHHRESKHLGFAANGQ